MRQISDELIKIASDILIMAEIQKIAEELQQFTGSEANLYRKQLKNTIEQSKEKILKKYIKGDN